MTFPRTHVAEEIASSIVDSVEGTDCSGRHWEQDAAVSFDTFTVCGLLLVKNSYDECPTYLWPQWSDDISSQ